MRSIGTRRARPVLRALAPLLLGVLALGSCGGGGITGTYVHEEKGPDGSTMSLVLRLENGNKAIATIRGGPGDPALPSVEGTYSVQGDQVTVVLDGDADVYTLKGDTLTTTSQEFFGETLVLTKR